MNDNENLIEGRNTVLEAFRSGTSIDKVLLLKDSQDGPLLSIARMARKKGTVIQYVPRQQLDKLSPTGKHQGVIAYSAAYTYAEVDDILDIAAARGEAPFIFILDGIEDPHNLGAIIRTANVCGAHGVIIPKHRACGLTAAAARASAGAVSYTPVARVSSLINTVDELKNKGLWFVCADMDGKSMYELDLGGPIGLVIGSEGHGASRLLKEHCDLTASIPMKGEIGSLNASVAAGVLAYEVVRRRTALKTV